MRKYNDELHMKELLYFISGIETLENDIGKIIQFQFRYGEI